MADASAGGQDPGAGNLFADPMASAAMMYGSSLANQGKDIVNKEVRCYVQFKVSRAYVMSIKWKELNQL